MPASLALPKPMPPIPAGVMDLAAGYNFHNGRRNAPPRQPEDFAAARLLDHVAGSGLSVRYPELWNEPNLPFWWCGSFDEWWAMHRAFAVVAAAAGYRVGGPSVAGLAPDLCRDELISRSAAEKIPPSLLLMACIRT